MKLIAIKDFYRTPSMKFSIQNSKDVDVPHKNHVPEGAAFEIGTSDTLAAMRESEPTESRLCAELIHAGCAVPLVNGPDGKTLDEASQKIVAKVQESLDVKEKREARLAKLDENASATNILKAFQALIDKAAAAPAK